jgi:hypothetical protein
LVTARPRGWNRRLRSGLLQRLRCRFTFPITRLRRLFESITVIVSWPLLATNTRRPFGEMTMFHGSAPVRIEPRRRSGPALNRLALARAILITDTVPDAAFATYAYLLFGSSATLWGSSPVLIVATTRLVFV